MVTEISLSDPHVLRASKQYCMPTGYVRYGDVPSMTPAELASWAAACSSAPLNAAPASLATQSGAGRHAAEAAADAAGRRAQRAGAASSLLPSPTAAAAAAAASGCTGGGAGLLAGSGQGAGAGSGGRAAARPACADSEATISRAPCRRGGPAGGSSAAQAAVDQASAPARWHSEP